MRAHGPLLALFFCSGLSVACGDKGDDSGGLVSTDGGATDGGATDGGASDGGASDGGAGDGGAGATEWIDMDRKERQAYMNEVVLPEMIKLFQARDAARYAKMDCSLCHGENFWEADVDYAMPNGNNADATFIGDGAPGAISWSGGSGDYAEYRDDFMPNVIVPAMAELLGTEPWSDANPDGLSCGACHPSAG